MKPIIVSLLCLVFCLHASSQNCVPPDSGSRREISDSAAPVTWVGQITVHRRFLFFGSHPMSTFSMISPNVLITAGHTLRNRFLHAHVKGISVRLGQRRVDGSLRVIREFSCGKKLLSIRVDPVFQKNGDPAHDYSFASLPVNVSNNFFPLGAMASLSSPQDSVFILGYPGDKGANEGFPGQELWLKGDTKDNIDLSSALLAVYRIYTFEGDSGAPIWAPVNGVPTLLGIHGTGFLHKTSCNAGILLTPDRIRELQDFIQAHRIP